jgi:hypothetical protein
MRFIGTVVLAALLLFLLYLVVGWIVDGYFDGNIVPNGAVPNSWAAPNSWSEWRDILLVFTLFFFMFAGILLVILMVALLFLVFLVRRILRENAAPAIDSLRSSLDNIRGTTEFAGETVVSPIIRTYAVIKGVRRGIGAVTNLPGRIRGRRKGKK